MNNKRGISLIVLVITIIVMIILASAIILSLSGNGIIFKTNKAKFQNDIATMKEELSVYISNKEAETNGAYDSDNLNASRNSLTEEGNAVEGKIILDIIKSMDKKYLDKVEIVNGKLRYTGSNINEIKWSDEILEGIKGYDLEEVNIEEANTVKLEDSVNMSLKNYRIYGNSVQNGTPSADTPVLIESIGEKTVNLVKDIREVFNGYAAYTELEEDGRKCIRFQSNNNTSYNLGFKENTQYTISCWSKCVKRSGYDTYPEVDVILAVRYTDGTYNYFSIPSDGVWRYCTCVTAYDKTIASIGSNVFDWRTHVYIDINTFQIQEGATVTDYEPYGYKIPVKKSGLNLFSMAKCNPVNKTVNGITFTTLDDERIHIKGKVEDTSKVTSTYIYPKVAGNMPINRGKYKAKWHGLEYDGLTMLFGINNGSGGFINVNSINSFEEVNFDNGYIENALLHIKANTTREFDDIIYLQIEKDTSNSPYEPYIEPKTYNIYIDEPLRKVGDYVDYIDFRSQEVVRNVEVVESTSGEQTLRGLDTPAREKITIPSIMLNEGTNIIEVLTKAQPSKIETLYYKK